MAGEIAADDDFVIVDYEPAFLALQRRAELAGRAERALATLGECRACPRACGVDRHRDEGLCKSGRHARVSSAFAHSGEEDCLRGTRGSGTVFFSGCNLACVFCQNSDISQRRGGRLQSGAELATIMLGLQEQGCHNINFVTPEHVVAQVVEAITIAAAAGLRIPIVYNTSAYDGLESLAMLDGLVDIYMPDFKLWEPDSCKRLLRARDYSAVARLAIAEMHRQVGPLCFDERGVAVRGLLVRHLVMPGLVAESAAIMGWLADEVSVDTFVNIMGQYHPEYMVGVGAPGRSAYLDIDRRPTAAEIAAVRAAARQAGLHRFDGRHERISVVSI